MRLELVHEHGVPERALAGLIDDNLARKRLELVHYVVAVLAADEQPAHLAAVADDELVLRVLRRGGLADDLARGAVGEVWQVALASVKDGEAGGSARLEELAGGLDGCLHGRQVPALDLAEAVLEEEVALHVDDEQRCVRPGEGVGVGFCLDGDCVRDGGHVVQAHAGCMKLSPSF